MSNVNAVTLYLRHQIAELNNNIIIKKKKREWEENYYHYIILQIYSHKL